MESRDDAELGLGSVQVIPVQHHITDCMVAVSPRSPSKKSLVGLQLGP